jgi:hypothetical protein
MVKTLAVAALIARSFDPAPAEHVKRADTAPYYMCFAYTEDGMLFAGGDFQFARAKRMISGNCGMPKSIKVVLVKTIMSHDDKTTVLYDK